MRAVCAALAAAAISGAGSAEPADVPPRAVVVSSTLERIAPALEAGAGADDVQLAAGAAASHADQLIVSVRFANMSDQVVDGLRITSPIPADVQYVAGSASGPGSAVLFSVDNGRTFGRPEELALALPDGGTRIAGAADYTHVRWILDAPLAAGAAGVARYRAVPR